ncbi:MAG: carboxypeptidase regulatory-like domain-containing protein, partial [Chlamydiia bacterium]|nr:carboxypeptidase regulatory-like domain-containing protein [Chlamydiia bacterium]
MIKNLHISTFVKRLRTGKIALLCALGLITACSSSIEKPRLVKDFPIEEPGVYGPETSGNPDDFRGAAIVNSQDFLIGGPLARGKVGDILIQNDKVRFILRQPDRMAGIGTYGGNIVDADLFRPKSEPGQDNFGFMYPLLNIAWTTNCVRIDVVNDSFDNGPVVVRTSCYIDVYDYIMTSVITTFSAVTAGTSLFYADRFNDAVEPFKFIDELSQLNTVVITDYTLKEDSSYLIMETKMENLSPDSARFPFGEWLNGSGPFGLFVPKQGFPYDSLIGNPHGLIYQGLQDDIPVSYGYFQNSFRCPQKEDGLYPGAAAIAVSGVTISVMCEESLLKLLPVGNGTVEMKHELKPGINTMTRYFVVGNGDAASVTNEAYKALGAQTLSASGTVLDSDNNPVENARVFFMTEDADFSKRQPITIAFTDENGQFATTIPTGNDAAGKMLGSPNGKYMVEVYKEGYLRKGTNLAGICDEGNLDELNFEWSNIQCTLGKYATFKPTVDVDGQPGPARV